MGLVVFFCFSFFSTLERFLFSHFVRLCLFACLFGRYHARNPFYLLNSLYPSYHSIQSHLLCIPSRLHFLPILFIPDISPFLYLFGNPDFSCAPGVFSPEAVFYHLPLSVGAQIATSHARVSHVSDDSR